MSDLVKRLRDSSSLDRPPLWLFNAAADRIERLEEALKAVIDDASEFFPDANDHDSPNCCDPYLVGRDAIKAARAALAGDKP
jgi:hypothetical protein